MTKAVRHIIFVWIILFISTANTFAQEDLLEKKITLSFQDETLGEILKTIEKAGNFHFSFRNKYVPTKKRISFEAKNESLSSVLNRLLNGLNLEYEFIEGELVLHPVIHKKQVKTEVNYSINGYIRDNASGESLIGTTIYVEGTTTGTISNAYGFYSLTLAAGKTRLVYSFVGYEPYILDIDLDSDQMIIVDLDQDLAQIQEVIIRNKGSDRIFGSLAKLSMTEMKPKQVKKIPALLGEVDLIKSLECMPGITFFGDGSTFFYVRGGNKDQNQILIDDAPIFNPAHLFGFFSNIIPDAIKDVHIYKGNMGPQKGGRLSSLIDIRTKDGNMKRIGVSGRMGLISARLAVEGPIVKDKSSFFISGRRSYFKWFVQQYAPQVQNMYFSDFNAKFNVIANSSNRFYLTMYIGKDDFISQSGSSDAAGINWGNVSGSIRWNHLFSERLFLNTIFYSRNYDYSLLTSVNRNDKWNSTIANTGLKTDFSYFMNPSTTLRFGLKIGFYEINPGNFTFGDTSINDIVPKVAIKNSLEWNMYFNYEKKIGEKLNLYLGLRTTLWQSVGPTTEYVFNEYHKPVASIEFDRNHIYNSYFSPEPRLAISFLLSEDAGNPGTYYTDSTVQGVTGRTYYLYINSDNLEFIDSAHMPPVEPLKAFSYRKIAENPDFYKIRDQSTNDPSIVKVYYDWSYLVEESQKEEARALSYYYSLNTIDVNEMFKPGQGSWNILSFQCGK